ncbi:MAG: sensor histidine kinase [Acidimicrobiia bacterium]|nr:sensor histidine kinase [Acidimicrobiia bacterium]
MDWIAVALILAAVAASVVAMRQRRRALGAEQRIAAVGAALPPDGRQEPVDRAVADLVSAAAAGVVRLGVLERTIDAAPIGLLVFDGALGLTFASRLGREMVEGGATERATMTRVRTAAAKALATGAPSDERVELFGRRRRILRLVLAPLASGGAGKGAPPKDASGSPADSSSRSGRRPQPQPPELRYPGSSLGTGDAVIVHLVDITEREQLEAMRRDFVANVSHELKTPLGALSVLAEALLDAGDDATRRRLAGRILGEAARMSDLVVGLLDLSLVESEEPKTKPIDVGEVLMEAVGRVAALADASGIPVRAELPDLPLVVDADRRQLTAAVANLLDNAVGHTVADADHTEVVVRGFGEGDQAVIEVQDHGVGIPVDQQDRIFERFYRLDRGRGRQHGGTGLGLAIVRHVARSHGGSVEVESLPGLGSTFRIRIPVDAT